MEGGGGGAGGRGGRGGRGGGGWKRCEQQQTKQTSRSGQMGRSDTTDDARNRRTQVTNSDKSEDTCGRMDTHIQKHRRTVAAHTHKHTHRGILVRCCQLPRWYIASCSGSSSTQALLIEGSKARTRRHNGATSLQLLLPRRSTGLNKIRASQESAAPPPPPPTKQNLHSLNRETNQDSFIRQMFDEATPQLHRSS